MIDNLCHDKIQALHFDKILPIVMMKIIKQPDGRNNLFFNEFLTLEGSVIEVGLQSLERGSMQTVVHHCDECPR
jgi:hypothetical protein